MRDTWLSGRSRALAFCTVVLLAACGDPAGSSAGAYTLRTVNEQALPAAYPDPLVPQGTFLVTAGELVLEEGGVYRGSLTIGCAPSLPAGTTCTVTEPDQPIEGTYSRAEGWLRLGERQYPAEFADRSVSVRIFIPQYMGLFPEYALRFTR